MHDDLNWCVLCQVPIHSECACLLWLPLCLFEKSKWNLSTWPNPFQTWGWDFGSGAKLPVAVLGQVCNLVQELVISRSQLSESCLSRQQLPRTSRWLQDERWCMTTAASWKYVFLASAILPIGFTVVQWVGPRLHDESGGNLRLEKKRKETINHTSGMHILPAD